MLETVETINAVQMSQVRDVNSGIGNSGKRDLELKGIYDTDFGKLENEHTHPTVANDRFVVQLIGKGWSVMEVEFLGSSLLEERVVLGLGSV